MVRLRHNPGQFNATRRLGDSDTYILVNTAAKTIVVYVDGVIQKKWS